MDKLILVLLLLSACVSDDAGICPTPDAGAPEKPAWLKIYEACGPRPPHWTSEDPATWAKAADIWMGCAIWVE